MKNIARLFFALVAMLGSSVTIMSGQVSVTSLCTPICQFYDGSGNLLSGGKIFTYAAGTTTPQATYIDSTGTTQNANPIILGSNGMPPNGIFLTANSYKFLAQTSGAVQVWVQDGFNNVPLFATTTNSNFIANANVTLAQTTAATSGANQSSDNFVIQGQYWTGSATATDSWTWNDVLGTGANPTSTLTLAHSGSSGTASVSIPVATTLASATITGALTAGSISGPLTGSSPWIDATAPPYNADKTGTNDATAAIQSAFNAIPTGVNAGGKIFFPCGTYKIRPASTPVTLPLNTPIEIAGEGQCTVIQKDFDTVGIYNAVFTSAIGSSYSLSTTLSANANTGDQQITVTSSTSFNAGDWIMLNDNTGFTGFNCTHYTNYEPNITSCNLELQQIDSIPDGTHINLRTSLTNAYTTAGVGTVYKIQPTYIHAHDMKFIQGPDCSVANQCAGRYFDLIHAIDSELDHNTFDVTLDAATQCHRCKHTRIFDNVFRNGANSQTIAGQSAYPTLFDEGTQDMSFNRNTLYKVGQVAFVSQANNDVADGNIFFGCGDDCFNTHGHKNHDIKIINNKMGALPAGNANASVSGFCVAIVDTDFRIDVENNECRNFGKYGIYVSSLAQADSYDINISGNIISDPVTNSAGTFPPNYLVNTTTFPNVGIFVQKAKQIRIINNTVEGSFPNGAVGIRCQGCTDLDVSQNSVYQLNGSATSDIGIYIDALTSNNNANTSFSNNHVTGWHANNCQFDIPSGTFSGLNTVGNQCYGGPGTNYNYNAGITTLNTLGNQNDNNRLINPLAVGLQTALGEVHGQSNGASGLMPTITSSGAAVIGDDNTTLGSGTGKTYGVIGLAKGSADAAGDKAYGGWFKASAAANTSTEVGTHAETADAVAAATIFEGAATGTVKFHFDGTGSFSFTNLLLSTTAPTIAAAGCGGAAATIPNNNGTAAFEVNVGTTPGSACTITMPTAAHGWACSAVDVTTNSTSVFYQKQSPAASQTATQIVITNFSDVAAATAFTASDVMRVVCNGY